MTNKHANDKINRRSALQILGASGVISTAGCIGGNSTADNGSNSNGSNGNKSDDGSGSNGGSGQSSQYTMGAGSDGSSTWSTGQALQQTVRNNANAIRITAQQTGGTQANLRLYSKGGAQIIGTSNYLYDLAKQEEGSYNNNPIQKFPHQAWSYGITHTYTLARKETNIETYEDLKGSAVWPLWSGSSITLPYKKLLKEVGIWDEMNIRNMSPSDVAGALESGRLDAVAVYGVSFQGLSGWATQVDTRSSLKLVKMNKKIQKRADDVLPTGTTQIEPYGWKNQNFNQNKTAAIPMDFRIFYGTDVSKDDAYKITKIVHENGQSLSKQVSILQDVSKTENLTQGTLSDYPIHPGVAKYLKEIDAWNNDWTVGNVTK